MTKREDAGAIVGELNRDLPNDKPLTKRTKIIPSAQPLWGGRSWSRIVWRATLRDYLVKFGYRPRTKAQAEREAAALPLFEGEL